MLKHNEKECKQCKKIIILKTKKNGELMARQEKREFCSNTCHNTWQKGKSYEELMGEEKAKIKIEFHRNFMSDLDNNPSHKEEIASKISESLKEYLKENPRVGEKNPFFGKHHTDEFKEDQHNKKKGKLAWTNEHKEKHAQNVKKGKDHHNWINGSSTGTYKGFTDGVKKRIKERDNHICMVCQKVTNKLAIHHIDYNKHNSHETNLISLCYSCHPKTNFNREEWEIFFKELIKKIYSK